MITVQALGTGPANAKLQIPDPIFCRCVRNHGGETRMAPACPSCLEKLPVRVAAGLPAEADAELPGTPLTGHFSNSHSMPYEKNEK